MGLDLPNADATFTTGPASTRDNKKKKVYLRLELISASSPHLPSSPPPPPTSSSSSSSLLPPPQPSSSSLVLRPPSLTHARRNSGIPGRPPPGLSIIPLGLLVLSPSPSPPPHPPLRGEGWGEEA
eukprot:7332732-Pyramimonas_sp.AAC.3